MQKVLDFPKLAEIQTRQTYNAVYIEGIVPAVADGGSAIATINISNRGPLRTERVTGEFSRLVSDGGNPAAAVDDGANHLKCKITSQSSGNNLFEEFIPLSSFLTPGGQRTPGVLLDADGGTPDPSQQLFFPMPLGYTWQPNDVITLEFTNDSDWPNTFKIAFFGIRGIIATDKMVNA